MEKRSEDKLYPVVTKVLAGILERQEVVAPVDVLVEMGLLNPQALVDWRMGRVPYLERVIGCNLAKINRILRILTLASSRAGLRASVTVYRKWGKGSKFDLRFSKSGEPALEKAYSTHFVSPALRARKVAARDQQAAQVVEPCAEVLEP